MALARALISEPEIVLFDEPTTGQDPIRKTAILSMIAAYQKKYNFSAILVSHDLPDVFFISNTILALYDGRMIFDGSPEEFEGFDHPFRKEFIHGLELLQQELTGLYSRRHFKMRYRSDLFTSPHEAPFTILLFRFTDAAQLIEQLGHTATQALIAVIGSLINEYFSDMGGISTRYSIDQYVTILPHANIDETRQMVETFIENLADTGISRMERILPADPACDDFVDVNIHAGVAQGHSPIPLRTVIASAGKGDDIVSNLKIKCQGKP